MVLDLLPLQKALESLEWALARLAGAPDDEELRDAVIKRYEDGFELSWKFLRRQLAEELPAAPTAEAMSFAELIREGARRGLIPDPERWFFYRTCRNLTAHTCDAAKAAQVAAAVPAFLADAKKLLAEPERRRGAAP